MDAACSSEMSVLTYQATQCHNPEYQCLKKQLQWVTNAAFRDSKPTIQQAQKQAAKLADCVERAWEIAVHAFTAVKTSTAHIPKYLPSRLIGDSDVKSRAVPIQMSSLCGGLRVWRHLLPRKEFTG
jgi:hypothetical protein